MILDPSIPRSCVMGEGGGACEVVRDLTSLRLSG